MRRALALVLLVATVPIAGCIDGALPGGDETVRESKVSLSDTFSIQDSADPDAPSKLAKVEDITFSVESVERDMGISIEVRYEQESPVPGVPSGNVTVNLTDPTDHTYRWTYPRGRSSQTSIAEPPAGGWNLVVHAQGEGSYDVQIDVETPER